MRSSLERVELCYFAFCLAVPPLYQHRLTGWLREETRSFFWVRDVEILAPLVKTVSVNVQLRSLPTREKFQHGQGTYIARMIDS